MKNILQPSTIDVLKFHRLAEDVIPPKYATRASACFDLHAYLPKGSEVKVYNARNEKLTSEIDSNEKLILYPGQRALVPTGLILDIPFGHSVRLHIRSSIALKRGISLANSEGVVDEDYVDPLFVLLYNGTGTVVEVEHSERIAQAELVRDVRATLEEIEQAPDQKTDRDGGFGSTGKS